MRLEIRPRRARRQPVAPPQLHLRGLALGNPAHPFDARRPAGSPDVLTAPWGLWAGKGSLIGGWGIPQVCKMDPWYAHA
jgi:hypothetical protein